MRISERGLALIKFYESLRLRPYKDAVGIWTVGYGHTEIAPVLAAANITLMQEQAEKLLELDVSDAEKAVVDLVKVTLTQGQFDALTSFVFNEGRGKLESSTLLKKLNAGDYAGAADEFTKWVYAGKAPLAGLIARRKAERDLFTGSEET